MSPQLRITEGAYFRDILDQPRALAETLRSLEADAALEGVGCETCHGRGGPHLSPDFVQNHAYEESCRSCHNPEHSLGFEYASFLPRVSHAANRANLALSPEEREQVNAAIVKAMDQIEKIVQPHLVSSSAR